MKRISIAVIIVLLMSVFLMSCASNVDGSNGDPNENIPPNTDSDLPPSSGDVSPDIGGDNSGQQGGEAIKPEVEKPTEKPIEKPKITYDYVAISTADKVNIRSGRGSKYSIVGTLRRGEGVAIIEDKIDGWYKVRYKEKYAYIYHSYVSAIRFPKSDNIAIERVIDEGEKLMGYPYVWGSQRYHHGNGILNTKFKMGYFDCSALTQYIFYKGAGIILDVTTRTQVVQGKLVRDDVKRGDLMFFTNSARYYKKGIERVGHVGIYLGNNYILHTADDYAVIEEISAKRWKNYLVSKRFF